MKGSEGGAKGSEAYSILGFRVPTTWNEKSLITTCSGEVFPLPETAMPTTCVFTELQKAFVGPHHHTKICGAKTVNQPLR